MFKLVFFDEDKSINNGIFVFNMLVVGDKIFKYKFENLLRKVLIEFGEFGMSDMKIVLYGKYGFLVKLNVYKYVFVVNSSFFVEKLVE